MAGALRLARVPLAWNYWAIDYLSYPLAHRDELAHGHLAWTRLTGLHPGLWSNLMAGVGALGGGVCAAWAFSLGCSLGAVAVAGFWLRRTAGPGPGLWAAGLLAVAPLQVHYGLELNNYPLYLLGAGILAAGTASALDGGRRRWAFVGALLTLHGHLAGVALVGAVAGLAAWRRRPGLLLTFGAATALSSPVLWAAAKQRGAAGTFHNERPSLLELGTELARLWPERFAPGWALVALGLGAGYLAWRALRGPHRTAAITLTALAGAGLVATLAGLLSGAAFVAQTPYWLQPSWALLTLAALGTAGLGRRHLAVLGLLGLWLLPASERGLFPLRGVEATVGVIEPPRWRAPRLDAPRHPAPDLPPGPAWAAPGFPPELTNGEPDVPGRWWQQAPIPGREGPRVRTLPAPDAEPLRAWVQRGRPDVLVWVWEPAFLNDDPRGLDPLFAALDPADVGDLRAPEAPFPGFCRDHRGGQACFLNRSSLRGGGFEAELTQALVGWLAAGLTVDIAFTHLDPGQVPPDPRRVRRAVAEAGGRWTDRFVGVTWVAEVRPGGT